MWIIVHHPTYGYGVIQVINDQTPYLLRTSLNGSFFVHSLNELKVMETDTLGDSFSDWANQINNLTILAEFQSDNPLQSLKDLYPEHFL